VSSYQISQRSIKPLLGYSDLTVFGQPFVKRFTLCYRAVVLFVWNVTLVYCGHTVGWIKMPLGTEVGLGPSHIVLDEDPAPPKAAQHPSPQFSAHVCCGETAGWINMPLVAKVGLDPGHIALDGDPAPPKKGHSPPFRPMPIVAQWLDGSRCRLVWR